MANKLPCVFTEYVSQLKIAIKGRCMHLWPFFGPKPGVKTENLRIFGNKSSKLLLNYRKIANELPGVFTEYFIQQKITVA